MTEHAPEHPVELTPASRLLVEMDPEGKYGGPDALPVKLMPGEAVMMINAGLLTCSVVKTNFGQHPYNIRVSKKGLELADKLRKELKKRENKKGDEDV